MAKRELENIIIGAGVSGLGCAKTLHKNGKKFLIITENVGGRVKTSSNGSVNYGAYYVRSDYLHIKKLVKLGRMILPWRIYVYEKNEPHTILEKKFIFHPIQIIRLVTLLIKFKDNYHKFQRKSEKISSEKALREDNFLLELYQQKASDFVKNNGLEEISKNYLNAVSWATAFSSLDDINAFTFLETALPLIIPSYEFQFLKKDVIKEFKSNIIFDSVSKISKNKKGYTVKGNNCTYTAKNLVVATPPQTSKKLLGLKKINKPVCVHMFHLTGDLKDHWKKGMDLFHNKSKDIAIVQQKNGSFIFYSRIRHPKFNKYFTRYKTIKYHFWNPAFNLIHKTIWKSDLGNNLYLIGDHNFCGMEDAFITGIYAANRIISKS